MEALGFDFGLHSPARGNFFLAIEAAGFDCGVPNPLRGNFVPTIEGRPVDRGKRHPEIEADGFDRSSPLPFTDSNAAS